MQRGSTHYKTEGMLRSLNTIAANELAGNPNYYLRNLITDLIRGWVYGDSDPDITPHNQLTAHISHPYNSDGSTLIWIARERAVGRSPNPACTSRPRNPKSVLSNESRQGRKPPVYVILTPKNLKLLAGFRDNAPNYTRSTEVPITKTSHLFVIRKPKAPKYLSTSAKIARNDSSDVAISLRSSA